MHVGVILNVQKILQELWALIFITFTHDFSLSTHLFHLEWVEMKLGMDVALHCTSQDAHGG